MPILKGRVKIEGVRPFFFHVADTDHAMPLEKTERSDS